MIISDFNFKQLTTYYFKLTCLLLIFTFTIRCKKDSITTVCGENKVLVSINNKTECTLAGHLYPYNRNKSFGFQCFPEGGAIEIQFEEITGNGKFNAKNFYYYNYITKEEFRAEAKKLKKIKLRITNFTSIEVSGITDCVTLISEKDKKNKLKVSLSFEKLIVNQY